MPASLRLVDHQWTISTQQDRAIQSKVSINVGKTLEKILDHTSCVSLKFILIAVGSQLQNDIRGKRPDGMVRLIIFHLQHFRIQKKSIKSTRRNTTDRTVRTTDL